MSGSVCEVELREASGEREARGEKREANGESGRSKLHRSQTSDQRVEIPEAFAGVQVHRTGERETSVRV